MTLAMLMTTSWTTTTMTMLAAMMMMMMANGYYHHSAQLNVCYGTCRLDFWCYHWRWWIMRFHVWTLARSSVQPAVQRSSRPMQVFIIVWFYCYLIFCYFSKHWHEIPEVDHIFALADLLQPSWLQSVSQSVFANCNYQQHHYEHQHYISWTLNIKHYSLF